MSSSILDEVVAGRAPVPMTFSVAQFHHMLATGVLRDGQPVELIEGVVMPKNRAAMGENVMGHGKRHAVVVTRIQRLLERGIAADAHIRVQLPVTLSDRSEPEPDIAVVRGIDVDYLKSHPRPRDVLLAVEVADSSLDYDRETKGRLYAAAGIGLYWVANLVHDQVEVFELPHRRRRRYERTTNFRADQSVAVKLGEGRPLNLPVGRLLGFRI
ncbi:MAG TPA: Uma2 family endonuclease [Pirellulales bacterium]|nr:Uma2 family endonuclease [Pirellulales bacterium]